MLTNDNAYALFVIIDDLAILELLIRHGVNINSENDEGETALFDHDASIEKIDFLIKNGADINHVNHDGETPIFYTNSPAKLDFFLNNGADINHVNHNGESLLFSNYRIAAGSIKFLIEKGLDIHRRNLQGQTVLIHYCDTAFPDLKEVEELLSLGLDPKAKDLNGKDAYDYIWEDFGDDILKYPSSYDSQLKILQLLDPDRADFFIKTEKSQNKI